MSDLFEFKPPSLSEERLIMRPLAYFVLLILIALFISALLNYPLYLWLEEGMDKGPHKLINTTAKLVAIPGFILLLRHYTLNSKQGLGYALPRPEFLREILRGWLAGFLILAALSIALFIFGIRIMKPLPADLGDILLKTLLVALIGGILIGFIEETFFRGGLSGALRKSHGFVATMILSSLFYAWMHFIQPPPLPPGEEFAWYSGLQMVSGAFNQYGDWATFDSFLALFGLGAFFAVVRERTGNIAYLIGLHAGFVFVIKTVRKFTAVDFDSPLVSLVGNYDGMIGYLSAAGLLVHTIIVHKYWRKPAN
ncbi:MAG: CPBP family intramembrane glutamic endopeptidase [Candidatus Sedimenticola sp. 4PFRAG1]